MKRIIFIVFALVMFFCLSICASAEIINQSDISYAYGEYAYLLHDKVSLNNGEYQQVEYLQSSGNEYLNLGSKGNIVSSEYKGLGKGALWSQLYFGAPQTSIYYGSGSSYNWQWAIVAIKKGIYVDEEKINIDFGDRYNIFSGNDRYKGYLNLNGYKAEKPMWSKKTSYTTPFSAILSTTDAFFNNNEIELESTIHFDCNVYGPWYYSSSSWSNNVWDGYLTQEKSVPSKSGINSTNKNGSSVTLTYTAPVYLFAGSNSPTSNMLTYSNSICFGFKYTDVNGYTVDLVPCYRTIDHVPGMYDIINNVFYTNSGTGEFITGPNVGTATIPTISLPETLEGYFHQKDLVIPVEASTEYGHLTYTWYQKERDIFGLWSENWDEVASNVEKDEFFIPTERTYSGSNELISEYKYYCVVTSSYSGTSVSKMSDEIVVTLAPGVYITFMLDGVTVYKTKYTSPGGVVTPPKDPARRGYIFSGWYIDDYYTYKVTTFDEKIDKVYAKWDALELKINYFLDGGTNNINNSDTHIYGTATELFAPTFFGRKFLGWYLDPNYENKVTYLSKDGYTKDINLYAKWEYVTINVSYVLNGGINNIDNVTSLSFIDTAPICEPEKPNYNFLGWFLDSSFTDGPYTKIEEETYEGDVVFYASWEGKENNITYYLFGGENNIDNKDTYCYGDVISLKTPSRVGHDFKGWFLDSEYTDEVTKIDSKSYPNGITLYAKWEPKVYEIIYKTNGGENSEKNPSVHVYGQADTIYPPTRKGYTFIGWYTSSDFLDNPITELEKTEYTDAIRLYAQWQSISNSYLVNYYVEELNGNGYKLKNTRYFEGKTGEIVYAEPITLEGFTYNENLFIEQHSGVIEANQELILNLYYKRNNYTITYFDGVNSSEEKTYRYEEIIDAPKLERKNYTFIEWSPSLPTRMPSTNISVTALWEKENQSSQAKIILSSDRYYRVNVNTPETYNAKVSKTTAKKGEIIQITLDPPYDLDITDVVVTTLSNDVRIYYVKDNVYEFAMPDSNVYVLASDNGQYTPWDTVNSYEEEIKVEETIIEKEKVIENVSITANTQIQKREEIQKQEEGTLFKKGIGYASLFTGIILGNLIGPSISISKYKRMFRK